MGEVVNLFRFNNFGLSTLSCSKLGSLTHKGKWFIEKLNVHAHAHDSYKSVLMVNHLIQI